MSSAQVRHKRRGAALSCAECRRLKLKCSRVFPCSNCVKKGCGAICPDGSLTTGKGNRFVLANTEVLHDKITQLATRVRSLEDALAQSHRLNSHQPHPLLCDELLQIKRPLERERLDHPVTKDEKQENADSIDAMGSLSISQSGRSTFYGQTANSWYLLQNEEGSDEEEKSPSFERGMPLDVPWLAYAFPFASPVGKSAESLRGSIISLLPKALDARNLCDIYYRHAAWMYNPISENDFDDLVFRPIYDLGSGVHEAVHSHNIAILCMVLAIGTLLNLERPSHSPEAIQYYQLGRAALSIDPIFEEQSISAIQALLLMCHYMFLDDIDGPRWAIMGLVVKLAQSVGLHRDSGKWNLDPEETFRRRCLLWEIFTYDSWQSLTYGRPPSFSLAHIDTKRPHESRTNVHGEIEMSFAAWKHGFCNDCLSIVHDQVFGAKTPSYKVIQEMDKKVRTYYVPPSLQVPGFGGVKIGRETDQPTTELIMQRYITFAIKEISIFYMHRGFFARALEDSPADPLGSKYSPSVLAAYNSACSFVGLINSLFKQRPTITERMWFLFTHVFSCSIVLGSIAAKSQMALAPSALSHLESAYALFLSVSETSRKNKILPILQKLKERAHAALSNGHHDISHPHHFSSNSASPPVKTEEDELAGLGGMTRLVSRKKSNSPSSPSYSSGSPVSQTSSSTPPISAQSIPEASPVDWPYTLQASPPIQHYAAYSNEDPGYHYHYPPTQHNVPLEGMSDYYSYHTGSSSWRADYSSFNLSAQNTNDFPMQASDISDPWQNLVAQYRN